MPPRTTTRCLPTSVGAVLWYISHRPAPARATPHTTTVSTALAASTALPDAYAVSSSNP